MSFTLVAFEPSPSLYHHFWEPLSLIYKTQNSIHSSLQIPNTIHPENHKTKNMILMPKFKRIRARRPADENQQQPKEELKLEIPADFRCPISLDLMRDPVILSSGVTYDRISIEGWFEAGNYTCPVTQQTLNTRCLIPNHTLLKMIQEWCTKNQQFGVERIPTPKSPLTLYDIIQIMGEQKDEGQYATAKQNAIVELRKLIRIENDGVQRQVLLKELIHEVEALDLVLINLVRKQVSPVVTRSCLDVILNIICDDRTMRSRFIRLELVDLVILSMVDDVSDRRICEVALAVFDLLCEREEGRRKACDNALTVPLLVKKLLRVSGGATELAVSALWKLCKKQEAESRGGGERGVSVNVMEEAVEVGAFQKLLLLLQMGCGDETREKATEILKMLNRYRDGLECIETVDFKNLNRSF
ncbi:hypothetical protein Ancab_029801 [Ancistrocladus abbreviatus]